MRQLVSAALRASVATAVFAGLMAVSDVDLPALSYVTYFAVLWGVFALFSFWEQSRRQISK
jgi:hypothetical protein